MSSFIKFPAIIFSVFLALTAACSDGKTGIASLRVSKDFEGKAESVSFKGGETLFASAVLANAPAKGKIVFTIKNDKGAILPGTEYKVDVNNSSTTAYKVQIAEKATPGKYILTADLHDGNGEKKDTKNADITIAAP
ncbi:MAG: hypothetical protein IPG22_22325 [Acidobacteria bacterium]|nr:hypothetical protein [Acidobacteriota bacterium]